MLQKSREYQIAVSDGVGVRMFKATNRFAYNEGIVYEYTNTNQQKDLVLVPHNYRYGQVDGYLVIGKNMGNSSAAPLIGDELLMGRSVDPDAPGESCALLYRTHMMSRGYKTLYEKNMPWKWLIIGIAALIVVVVVVWFIRTQGVS